MILLVLISPIIILSIFYLGFFIFEDHNIDIRKRKKKKNEISRMELRRNADGKWWELDPSNQIE
jgi:hypothetical protein